MATETQNTLRERIASAGNDASTTRMRDLIMACGAAAGVRWAQSVALTPKTQEVLAALDHAFAADEWDYRHIYADLARATPEPVKTADDWWAETAGASWPDREKDRAIFVRAFVIAAACALRNSQFS